jgi:hypothetical protein
MSPSSESSSSPVMVSSPIFSPPIIPSLSVSPPSQSPPSASITLLPSSSHPLEPSETLEEEDLGSTTINSPLTPPPVKRTTLLGSNARGDYEGLTGNWGLDPDTLESGNGREIGGSYGEGDETGKIEEVSDLMICLEERQSLINISRMVHQPVFIEPPSLDKDRK